MTTVVDRFLDACKMKIDQIQEQYNLKDSQNLNVEEELSADSILSYFILEESDPKRIERESVYPWIRYYWDNIRSILDLLRLNAPMEELYHSVCIRAFAFCTTYNRVNEFITLRKTLHKHLDYIMNPSSDAASNRFRVIWGAKTAEKQIETRFAQLKAACSMQLWSEAFNIMTDMCAIFNVIHLPLPIEYYQYLTVCFWNIRNHLYHALAEVKSLAANKKSNKELTEEALVSLSCEAIVASLCIPTYSPVCFVMVD